MPPKTPRNYRGASVEDLDPPRALSVSSSSRISAAMAAAYERDFTHLTVIEDGGNALVGYISMPRLQRMLEAGKVEGGDKVQKAMTSFKRGGRDRKYWLITMDTPLEELERFFDEVDAGEDGDFAVVTDARRRFVLGVATRADLEEFVKRRPVVE
ncbi:hypothetical protein K470DRAFT_251571 [Piedraia hortae CBS 480.64]|uniref:CBS domain-containing protein n=1 Tax=Piedraia hortae CBS 480.64 TaxID=1314780 RepID=A0A6A7BTR8_9PEZI|nr:hypothetical protein K470DRAFT_251571 [Piedraia hortae CBS 480.64]